MANDAVVDVSQDWILACDVQQRFMRVPDGRCDAPIDCSAQCRQVRALGGDCYDFLRLPGNHIAIVVGDASGKGLAAALMIASVQSSLRTAAQFTRNDLATQFEIVNAQAHASSLENRYATVFYGLFDVATYDLRYVNAGHNATAILRTGGPVQWLQPTGAPVGIFPDSRFQVGTVHLYPGDLLLAYTDGVVEATNSAGEEWGVEGLLQAAIDAQADGIESTEKLAASILASMDEFTGGRQTDDATLALLRVPL